MIKEKWNRLGYSDLAEVLAYDELQKLEQMSLSSDIVNICQKQLDSIADSFRGSFIAKGYNLDIRQHYIPSSYRMYVLTLAREYICTRFPNSENTFLDEPRQKLYDKAQEMLENPILGTPVPDYSDDTQLSSLDLEQTDSSITIPYQRIISQVGKYGFSHPYNFDYQT